MILNNDSTGSTYEGELAIETIETDKLPLKLIEMGCLQETKSL